MDAKRFDHLARTLSADGSRRGVLQLLGTLPLFGWLTFFLNDDGAAKRRKKRKAKGGKGRDSDRQKVGAANHKHEHRRRKHRNKRNNHHKDKHKHDEKTCKPESLAQTCDGQCGTVQNNCKKAVDCGSCACDPACSACTICDAESGQCQADPAQDTESCGGCRVCDNGACVTDETIVCTASDQCHEAGVCDPATGECTNPRKEEGTPCDDNDPCTTDDTCQQGECRGAPRDCSAASDVCNDGVCRSADGECITRPKQDGAGCNADNNSCTAGDSCQNGVCTPGAGVDCSSENDECNRGVCQTADGQCVKEPRDDGTPCGTNGECVNGACEEVACLALRESCNPSDNQCCGEAGCAETLPNCNEPGDRCCLATRETCGHDCECCGLSFCEDNACCSHTGNTCQTAQDCCQNVLNQQDCVNNRCCALPEEPCEGPDDCCDGLCDPEGFCTSCLGLQQECEDEGQCCQSGGATQCAPACDFDIATCCRPPGGACGDDCDCCGGHTCCGGVCCGFDEECVNGTCQTNCRNHGANCLGEPDICCPGLECRSANFETVCRPDTCLEFAEFCGDGARPCCEGECTSNLGTTCCSPEGAECDDLGRFFPGGDCCGTNVCNGANQCARCRQLGETCDGFITGSTNNCCNTLGGSDPLLCDRGICARCPASGERCAGEDGGDRVCCTGLCRSDGTCP